MLDSKQFADIIAEHEPGLEIRRVVPIHEGWDSVVFEVNGEYMFRFARRDDVVAQHEMELRLLPLLAKALTARVPEPEFVGRDESGRLEFFGYRKVPGRPMIEVASSAERAAQLAVACAGLLTELHGVPVADARGAGVKVMDADQWRADLADFRGRIEENAFPHLNKAMRTQVDETWEGFLSRDDNFQFDTVLIHGDLSPDAHILCEEGAISGVIDWGDACVGDPALDFAGLFHACGRSFTERVVGAYKRTADKSFFRRINFYRWMIPFYEIEFSLATDSKDHLDRGLSALKLGLNL